MKSIVVLPVPLDSPKVWLQFRNYIERFCSTWKKFPPGSDLEIAAVCCNASPDESVRRLFLDLPARFYLYKGQGADLGAQQWFAHHVGGNPFLINATSRMYFHREGWAERLVSAREVYGPGLYGMSASYEGGSLHVCTRGHCLDAKDLRDYPTEIGSRDLGVFFECGKGNLFNWFETEHGGTARMVYWDGVWEKSDWMARPNTFRKGTQRNMLAWDKHTDYWEQADPHRKQMLEEMCLGVTTHDPKSSISSDGPARISALMPLKIDPEKSKLDVAAKDIARVSDEFLVLWDRPEPLSTNRIDAKVTEYLTTESGNGKWNDWQNRATLLVRAAQYGCRWAMWLDDDETLGPTLTRDRVIELCEKADACGYTQIIVKVRTAWDETHWRKDGVFGGQEKTFFQINPFLFQSIHFEYGPAYRLHHFPTLHGPKMTVDDYIIHWGMRSPSLREKNIAKYAAHDPEKEFTGVDYNYLMNEEGMILEDL